MAAGLRIHITGVVQGVGFRPFVYALATRLQLTGWVRNTSAGVDIEADGPSEALQAFITALQDEAPPLARIDSLDVARRPVDGFTDFRIIHSEPIQGAFQPISPDVNLCPDCRRELFDPSDRRYRYPFINCTNCGPRFTIIADIPYDRPNTTMAGFPLCPACAAEYEDPLDRRFHAQPVACPECGPHVWLETSNGKRQAERDDAILDAQRRLAAGKIVAIKGLGGFHLACDAANPSAVAELRRRKLRVDKPFGLMMACPETVERHCFVDSAARELLESRPRPIVLLERRPGSSIAVECAPGQNTLGVMLPYTPLHELLFAQAAGGPEPVQVLVMTSGNLSEEPIAVANQEARERLAPLADAFLMHNRPIRTRCDDSVVRVFDKHVYPLRRSRGYAPFPVRLPWQSVPILAAGPELKNTFCLTRDRYAFLSHHIGDLENFETLQSFEDGVTHFERLFRIRPEALACDLHPDYLATRYAHDRSERESLPLVEVQHHHAHIAACLAEHGLADGEVVIGVSLDGTGYGPDGAIWGGEFLLAGYSGYRRLAHLVYTPLPGGEKAIREPWRMALSWLAMAGLEWAGDLAPVRQAVNSHPAALEALRRQLQTGLNAPPTSSMGRLFDAAAALAGVRQAVNYEAQAAVEFEALADWTETTAYPFDFHHGTGQGPWQIDPAPALQALVADIRRSVPLPVVSARFQNGLARLVVDLCCRLRTETGAGQVALSGGVWQNMFLLVRTAPALKTAGFTVLTHRLVPANDGGISLGQAAVTARRLKGN